MDTIFKTTRPDGQPEEYVLRGVSGRWHNRKCNSVSAVVRHRLSEMRERFVPAPTPANKNLGRVSALPASPFTRPRPWLTVLAVIGGMVGWGLIFGVCYLIYIWRF